MTCKFLFQLAVTPELSYVHTIAVSEVLMRSAKHVFTIYMQGLEMTHLSVAVSHFLNCLLTSAAQVKKKIFLLKCLL